jgi:hypothetical protein
MTFSETARVEKQIGFFSNSVKTGKVSSKEVKEKFGKLFSKGEPTKRSKFTIVNGVPCKRVDGKLVPLTPLK